MTDREKAIVMAYTGICTLAGTKFEIFHKYVEDIMGRPVQTIEMGIGSVRDEITERSRDDFMAICREEREQCEDCISRKKVIDTIYCECSGENLDIDFAKVLLLQRSIKALPPVTPQPKMGKWVMSDDGLYRPICDKCGAHPWKGYIPSVEEVANVFKFCPNCGVKMENDV